MQTLEDIKNISKTMLSPEEVCRYMGGDPHILRDTVRRDKKQHTDSLGFPVMIIGNRIKIPKDAFVAIMSGKQNTLKGDY